MTGDGGRRTGGWGLKTGDGRLKTGDGGLKTGTGTGDRMFAGLDGADDCQGEPLHGEGSRPAAAFL